MRKEGVTGREHSVERSRQDILRQDCKWSHLEMEESFKTYSPEL